MSESDYKLEDFEPYSIHAWILNHQMKTENGSPIDFYTHRFLFDIYIDPSPFICSIKAAQIGFTTFEILKTSHEAYYENIDIIYVLPTADDVKQFSGGKTNRIIDNNPILQKWTNDKDSVEQKKFGKATVYYRGSWTERTALMISAQKLVVDEFDRCKQSIIEQYDSRLQHVLNPRKAFFSNPTIPDFGIDVYWKKSDMKRWNITHSCGKTYPMEENCIDYGLELYICPECGGEITDEQRRMGEWYNKDGVKWDSKVGIVGNYEWSGWGIPLWINPMFSATKITAYKKGKTAEYFANFVAGMPYVNPNDALSQATMEKNLTEVVNERSSRTIIGLDTGHNLHYTLANKQGIYFHGYCPSVAEMGFKPGYDPYDAIENILRNDKNSILIADQGGDLIGIRKLQAKYLGRVFLCWFTKETKNKDLIRWGEGTEYGKVLADRNRVIQLAVDQLNETRFNISGSKTDWQPWVDHWLNIYRTREITDENEPTYGWRWVWKRKGPDHWALATCYALIGLDKYAEELARIIEPRNNFMLGVSRGSSIDGTIQAGQLGVRVDL